MKNRTKVKDNYYYERDMSSGAIINNNDAAYQRRLKQKEAEQKATDEMAQIKSELAEIKALLKRLGGN